MAICRAFLMAEAAYTAKDITVLEGLDPVRLRPGMYIGSTGSRGLHHLVYEVVDNAVDEALAGHNDLIEVVLHPDNSVTVNDAGRGIPVDVIPEQNLPALTVVLTKLHAGGKFGGEGYRISGGLHGVGLSVVNALSAKLTVEVMRDGGTWTQSYSRGKATSKLTRGKATRKTGTIVTFWPDPEIFVEGVEFDAKVLAERLQERQVRWHALGVRCAAAQHVQALVIQNGNAYEAGIGPNLAGLAPYWQDREAAESAARQKSFLNWM